MSSDLIATVPLISSFVAILIIDQTTGKHTWRLEDIEHAPRPFSCLAPVVSKLHLLPSFYKDMIPHGQSASDTFRTANLLSKVIPGDVVPQVMDLAEFWVDMPLASTTRWLKVDESTAGQIYLLAELPSTLPPKALRSLTFRVTSRDQGWSATAFHNTYKESYTWFEVAILPPGTDESKGPFPGRKIITNLNAGFDWHTHDVTWKYHDRNKDIRKIVRSLGRGYKIAICAWARFPEWVNRIQFARIDCQVNAVRKM
ncbi:hypothetical protein LTR20_007873 [Exophiala xenobiotica]|nr:hypothetical protein LTS13_002712 [Exophiala xenobiotica]KAK5394523.1 hypothetical protein LTR79_007974 [Exophiala xenobiotica]KAK5423662.1 hypothetical protein LTR90_001007 [Exophiala xenobiotica]KAK5459202.1 hypothetical protein LTR20_007873 [Exophiala xenobiotica]KAK5479464.1 hypothetical protein LTR26_007316 [Exophiala xenobiotica]